MKFKFISLLFIILVISSFRTNVKILVDEHPLQLFLPDDLKAELWAESPMLYNPTNLDVDVKGRIWVTEAVNYRNFNNDSTKFFHHEKGDRVMILSDTNGDGKADDSKVFVEDKDLISPLGIAVIGNEIYVSCAPHLIKYTDLDGDDKPDKKEIFLTGFGTKDHDHSLHSIVGGPDGMLYFNVGNAGPHNVTDKSGFTVRSGSLYTGGTPYNLVNNGNQKSDDGKVYVGGLQFKINPNGTGLKVLGHNFRNSYETYVDGNGDMWQNDNDDQVVTCRVSWLAEGGNAGYFSKDGTRFWSADQRAGQDMFTAHWHQQDPGFMPAGDNSGAGSPTGMLRIEGNQLGQKYQGLVLSADAGRNMIFAYQPQKTGSGYNLAGLRTNFISSNAADNQAYEWNDNKFESDKSKWFRPSDMVIGTDGALYVADWYDAVVGGHQIKDKTGYGRIYRISPKNTILKTPNLNLETLKGQIEAFKNPAVNVRYQALMALAKESPKNFEAIKSISNDANSFTKARSSFLMVKMGKKGIDFLKQKLLQSNENEKIVAFRALRSEQNSADFLNTIKMVNSDNSIFLKREIIVALENYNYDQKKNEIRVLVQNMPENDPYYYNAIELALGEKKNQFYVDNKPFLIQNPKYFDLLFTLNPTEALPYFVNLINSEITPNDKKIKALTAIAYMNTKEAVNAMIGLQSSKIESVAKLADYWVSFKSSNDWFNLHDWSKNTDALKKQRELTEVAKQKERILNEFVAIHDRKNALKLMTKNATGSQVLIEMLKENQIATDLLEIAKIELLNNQNLTIKYQAQKYFDENKTVYTEAEVLSANGNEISGKNLFKSYCTNCHKVAGEGAEIGPDLTKISQKLDKTGLFEALTKPNSSIVFGYETSTFETKDGNSYYGILISENTNSLTIKDLAGKKINISQKLLKSRKKEMGSIMPSAISLGLQATQLNDLITYLNKLN